MSTIAQEINAITTAQGGTATGQTIAEAVNALADTLAGEDVAGGRTIAEAVHNIAPYVGGGGGGDFGNPAKISALYDDGENVNDISFNSVHIAAEAWTTPPHAPLVSTGSCSNLYAASGTYCTVWVSSGYTPDKVTYNDAHDEHNLEYTSIGSGGYTFLVPDGATNVNFLFV